MPGNGPRRPSGWLAANEIALTWACSEVICLFIQSRTCGGRERARRAVKFGPSALTSQPAYGPKMALPNCVKTE